MSSTEGLEPEKHVTVIKYPCLIIPQDDHLLPFEELCKKYGANVNLKKPLLSHVYSNRTDQFAELQLGSHGRRGRRKSFNTWAECFDSSKARVASPPIF